MRVFGAALLFAIIYIQHVESKIPLEQLKTMVKKIRAPCVKKTGVSEDLVDGTHQGNFPADPDLMCYHACLLQTLNVVKNNKINGSFLAKQIGTAIDESVAPQLVEMVNYCVTQATAEELCEATQQFVKCWWDKDSSLFLFP